MNVVAELVFHHPWPLLAFRLLFYRCPLLASMFLYEEARGHERQEIVGMSLLGLEEEACITLIHAWRCSVLLEQCRGMSK